MRKRSSNFDKLRLEATDNTALSRMLIQLIDRYLNEKDDTRRREIFSELTSLRQLSMLLGKGRQ